MVKIQQAYASFSVSNLDEAKAFYGEKLGLTPVDIPQGLKLALPGGGELFIYPKENHEPATYTVLNLMVENIDAAVDELIAAGITFEQYDLGFAKTNEKGIARSDNTAEMPNIAWFKDPAGNICAVLEMSK